MSLEFEIPLVSLIFIFMLNIVYFAKKKINLVENKLYEIILISSLIAAFIDTILHFNGAMHNYEEIIKYYFTFADILNKIISGLFILIFSCLFCYIMLISYKMLKKNIKKIIIPLSVFNVICYINLIFTKIKIIRIGDVTNVAGPTITIGYIAVALLLFLSLLISLINIKKFDKRYLAIFLILPMMGVLYILTIIFPGIIIYDLVLALLCYIMYFTIENPDLKLVRELRLAKTQAEKSNRAKTDFLSSMSHEIRTPLNAIVGLSEMIKESEDIEEIHEDVSDIIKASNNLLEIVNGILDISKIEADKMEILESEYKPLEEFEEIKKLIVPRIGEKPIEFRSNFGIDIPEVLYGDKGKIKQIILNLLTNAVKYTEKGYIDFNVSCINETDETKLVISVRDTGRGIKEEQMDKLFTKFNRLESDLNTTLEGTGLGLAITKSLVDMMNGKIVVQSKYGSGSTFTVFISQKKGNKKIEEVKIKEEEKSYKNKKALIVDDNKLNIKVAKRILEKYEIEVSSVLSGFECIENIKEEEYDIIFMDIMMPKMSGLETLKKLKEIDGFKMPVVALTADAMAGKSTKYKEAGFDDYLSKPIEKEQLKRVLDKYLENKKIEEEKQEIKEEEKSVEIIKVTDEDIKKLNELINK